VVQPTLSWFMSAFGCMLNSYISALEALCNALHKCSVYLLHIISYVISYLSHSDKYTSCVSGNKLKLKKMYVMAFELTETAETHFSV